MSKVTRISATDAKTRFGEVIRRVQIGREYIIVEKDGIPVLGILDADELEDYLDLRDEELQEQSRHGSREYKSAKTRPVEKILAEVRASVKRKK